MQYFDIILYKSDVISSLISVVYKISIIFLGIKKDSTRLKDIRTV